ncbi:MAG: hypothetical protein PHV93_03535 [Candidatus Pacebacteria bacterium]|nr:hypothetical protein [Candidatus Paceibacterota bacterium]
MADLANKTLPELVDIAEGLQESLERETKAKERLQERMNTETVFKETSRLSLELGKTDANLKSAQLQVSKLEAAREVHVTQATGMEKVIAEKNARIAEIQNELDDVKRARKTIEGALLLSQATNVGRSWGPYVGAVAMTIIMAVVFVKGFWMPRTGDVKTDVYNAVGQLSSMMWQERDRAQQLQNADAFWGVKMGKSTDGEASFTVNIWPELSGKKKADGEYISGLILTALRFNTAVVTPGQNIESHIAYADAPEKGGIQFSDYLNDVLNHSRKDIDSHLKEFNVNINVEYLHVKEENFRQRGIGFFFRDGKFTEKQEKMDKFYPDLPPPGPGDGKG